MIKYRDKIFYFLCGIVCVAFILSYAVTNIATALLMLLFFIDKKSALKIKLKAIKDNKMIWLYCGFFLAQLIGLLYTEDLHEGLRRVEVMSPLFFLPAVIMTQNKNAVYFNKLLRFLQYSIPLIFIGLMLIHLLYDQRTISTFVHFTATEKLGVSQFYLVFILMVPLLVSIKWFSEGNNQVLNAVMLTISLVLILTLGNKMTVIMLFILFFLVIFKNIKNTKRAILGVVVVIFLGLASYNLPIVNERFSTLFKTTDFDLETIITKNSFTVTKNTLEHRVIINYVSVKEIVKALPFGVGTGDAQNLLTDQYKDINFKAGLLKKFNNHNQYLSEFLKTGFLGGVLFIGLLFVINKQALRANDVVIYVFTIFFTLACFIESYLFRQHGIVIFAFLIPLFLTHSTIKDIENENT